MIKLYPEYTNKGHHWPFCYFHGELEGIVCPQLDDISWEGPDEWKASDLVRAEISLDNVSDGIHKGELVLTKQAVLIYLWSYINNSMLAYNAKTKSWDFLSRKGLIVLESNKEDISYAAKAYSEARNHI